MSEGFAVATLLLITAVGIGVFAARTGRRARRLARAHAAHLDAATGLVGRDWPLAGLDPGTTAPRFNATGLDGRTRALPAQIPTLLVFSTAGEPAFVRLGAMVDRLQQQLGRTIDIRVVLRVPERASGARLAGATDRVVLDPEGVVAARYGVTRSPSAVLVNADGIIATPTAAGHTPVHELVTLITEASLVDIIPAEPFVAFAGESATGHAATIEHRGRPMTIAILGVNCRHSTRLLPTLRDITERRPHDQDFAVIVTGGIPPVDLRLDTEVVVDRHDQAAVRFGFRGTPALVDVDAAGVIRSVRSGTADCETQLREAVWA